MLGNPKQSWSLDSKPWIPDSRHLIPVFSRGTLDWIPILSRIPDSLSCIPDSKAQDSGFHKQKFHGFHNPDSLTWADAFVNILLYIVNNHLTPMQESC